ncbi:MAG: hypothetical protein Ta2F_03200 [Termitinemataceae bacterium]|nr:MAG: hypothetical protein Ta2F_03200 [Termitinemataceae bacterium]
MKTAKNVWSKMLKMGIISIVLIFVVVFSGYAKPKKAPSLKNIETSTTTINGIPVTMLESEWQGLNLLFHRTDILFMNSEKRVMRMVNTTMSSRWNEMKDIVTRINNTLKLE